MANEEHLAIMMKGVKAWNEWRGVSPDAQPDIAKANLHGANLYGADLSRANLDGADLSQADLGRADLNGADLSGATLHEANLSQANLTGAHLGGADLNGATLRVANLTGASCGANLISADLTDANLNNTDLRGAWIGYTLLANIDVSTARGLDDVVHQAPSTIGIDTVYRSKGRIPDVFLRGAGVPEPFIANMKALVAAMEPIQFYSCFISYSSKDQEFAERLHADLQNKGVRCWFAPEDLKIRDKFRTKIDEAIRIHDKLLLVLTESSVKSAWVEKEVETAFEKERRQGRTVLFPIRLDDAVMEAEEAWAADIRRTRHIGDFCGWKGHDKYKKAFERLMRDLKAED